MKKNKHKFKYKSVMLVDDNEIDNFINEKYIQSSGFSEATYIHTSTNSALEFLNNILVIKDKFPKDLIPEYIFLDLNMPILDGFNFLDEFIKLSKNFGNKIKVIVLTSSLNPYDIKKTKQYKCVVDYISKLQMESYLIHFKNKIKPKFNAF